MSTTWWSAASHHSSLTSCSSPHSYAHTAVDIWLPSGQYKHVPWPIVRFLHSHMLQLVTPILSE